MKHTIKNIICATLVLGVVAVSFTSCYESRYYHENHHHTRGWYDRHRTPPPPGVRFDVDVHH